MTDRDVYRRGTRSASLVGAALSGYVAGMMPSADLVSRMFGAADLRTTGSGNPGAANAAATIGASAGLMIMAADVAKGVIAGRLGRRLGGASGLHIGAVAGVVGHCYPAGNDFRGGKGVATSVGQVLVSFPVYFPIDAAVAVATAALPVWKQRAFGATMVASAVWIGASVTWWRRGWPNLWGPEPSAGLPLAALASSAVIGWRFATAEAVPVGPL